MTTEPVIEPEFEYQVDFATGQPYPIWARARRECPVIHTERGMVD